MDLCSLDSSQLVIPFNQLVTLFVVVYACRYITVTSVIRVCDYISVKNLVCTCLCQCCVCYICHTGSQNFTQLKYFVTGNLQTVFHTQFVITFVIYVHTKIPVPSCNQQILNIMAVYLYSP